ncbi:GNAT family N-acetyltransferase [Albibacterium bauzanense]|uniref:N-acetylglutamate synthase-like GNAT family acetyltransferase n=1 Tax=Albibacterium bauzanense TaxID=653929 RepID=A0A4R1LZC5_9SPHI|nr:GNAT family N-acetyltransferase [Albibacterium bauzanense]TCK84928.1 N-acetylglutamate synthase-like GNAT family acetyltransferase [Albibacterium bauzanense]
MSDTMQIRKANSEDIPKIIELLKISLGESLIPKSEKLWRWKHIDNPFGASTVLLAEENEQIIGLRAFMNWEWKDQDQSYKTVRAVDTATHPAHQGKGIFKNLTLKGLEEIKQNTAFVFNTPNQKSKPGYLKMGWEEQGRMPIQLKINPFAFKGKIPLELFSWNGLKLSDKLFENPGPGIQTNYSRAYFEWRYSANPMFDYQFLTDNDSYLIVYRYKQHKFGVELRIVDFLVNKNIFNSDKRKQLSYELKLRCKRVFLTTVSGNHYKNMNFQYPFLGLLPILKIGPMITLKNIGLSSSEFEELLNTESWIYSLGDLELF